MQHSKLAPVGRWIAAAIIAVLTFACTADAVQTTTTPNVSVIPFNLAAGAVSGNLTPPAMIPVLIMGACTTLGDRAIGSVSLLRIPTTDPSGGYITWSGQNAASGGPDSGAISAGVSPPAAPSIIFIDFAEGVWLERGTTTDTVRVHNFAGSPRAGTTTWIW
jgi:hypothetical protein